MQIFVRTSRRTIALAVEPSDTVEVLKRELEATEEDMPAARQQVVFQGRLLEDARTLAECKVERESTVQVALRAPPPVVLRVLVEDSHSQQLKAGVMVLPNHTPLHALKLTPRWSWCGYEFARMPVLQTAPPVLLTEGNGGKEFRGQLVQLPEGLRELAEELQELTVQSTRLAKVPAWVGELERLEVLDINGDAEERPLLNTTLRTLPASLGRLRALKALTLRGLSALLYLPDLRFLHALEGLTLDNCHQLEVPASIMHLSQLQQLSLIRCRLQQSRNNFMPCLEALTALRTLQLEVKDYARDSRTFKALSRSLPCLKQLDTLCLGGDEDNFELWTGGNADTWKLIRSPVALRAEDVLEIGRALRAWPLPLLHTVKYDHLSAQFGIRLSSSWQELALPAAGADWTNAATLDFFRLQQQKVAAFASGMHVRLGASSVVSRLHEQILVMIADEVLGGWGLCKEWQQHELPPSRCVVCTVYACVCMPIYT